MSQTKKIVEMIRQGKISSEDGDRLLAAIGAVPRGNHPEGGMTKNGAIVVTDKKKKKSTPLNGKIVISITSSNEEEVKINLPLTLAGFAINMIPGDKLNFIEKEGFNIREIVSGISEMVEEIDEDIVNIKNGNGDRIRIYVESV